MPYLSTMGNFIPPDPFGVFTSWTRRQQAVALSVTTFVSVLSFIALKKKYTRHKMKQLGYRELDQMSFVNQTLNDNNFPLTIFGFEFANAQRLTFKDVQYFAQKVGKCFINFRCRIVNKNGTYYLNETDTFDAHQCVHYVKLVMEDQDDECIIQHAAAVHYVNQHNLINVKWSDCDRPNWDMFYLHYEQQNKCFVFFRCNHVLIDGLFASACISLLQFHLWGESAKPIELNRTNIDNILREDVLGQTSMKKPWWYSLYMVATLIPSFIGIVSNVIGMRRDPVCSINGRPSNWTGNYNWAVGTPIPIAEFKNFAHAHGGTVNDFFLLLCSKAIKVYMKLQNDTSNIKEVNAVGVKSTRDLSTFTEQFMEYCVNGTNGNELMYIPYSLPIQNTSMELIQSRFAKIKYGLSGWWTMQAARLLAMLPAFFITNWIQGTGSATTFVSSNLIASKRPLPIPQSKGMNGVSNGNECITWAFGMGTPASANMNFTVMTYNGHIRLGVAVEVRSVSDTKLLVKCFMDQYKLHANAAI
eukprot:430217_1